MNCSHVCPPTLSAEDFELRLRGREKETIDREGREGGREEGNELVLMRQAKAEGGGGGGNIWKI
jgi:hypothetical protein